MHDMTKLEQLKKKLFVLGGYLMVTAALLVYVSYSQYRISFEGHVEMPSAYNVQAVLGLNQSLSSDGAIALNPDFLNNIAPGSNAETYASNNDDNHKILVRVANSDPAAPVEDDSHMDLTYKLYIRTSGRIPLKFVTSHGGILYTATAYTGNNEEELIYRFKDNSGNEPLFKLEGEKYSLSENEIYVGWDVGSDAVKNEDARFRKEVDELIIVAEIVAESPKIKEYETTVTEDQVHSIIERAEIGLPVTPTDPEPVPEP